MQHRGPFQLAVALDERQQRQRRAGEEQADGNQLRFTEQLDHPANHSALDKRADDAAENEQRNDAARRHGGVLGDAEVEIVADQQRQRAFKTTECERRQKKNQNQQTDFRLRRCVCTHCANRGRLAGVVGTGFEAFGEDDDTRAGNSAAQSAAAVQPGAVTPPKFQRHAADGRAEDEAEAERHADQAHPLGSGFPAA